MKKKNVDEMSVEELSRWFSLIKAVDLIEENCYEQGKSFDDIDLKPIAIKHYINSLSNNIQKELEIELEQEKIKKLNASMLY